MEKITLYYFLLMGNVTLARGENIKLFLVDSGLEHEYVRVSKGNNWIEKKAELAKRGNYRGTLPYIEMGDKLFTGTVPILRYLSAKLGKYTGSNAEENQYIDTVVDTADDWFNNMKKSFSLGAEALKAHQETELPNWLSVCEMYYGDSKDGPYLLGDRITYADMMVYHMIDDEGVTKKLDDYPNLYKFVASLEDRPNIKLYLTSLSNQALQQKIAIKDSNKE